jgi:hypothetical protein
MSISQITNINLQSESTRRGSEYIAGERSRRDFVVRAVPKGIKLTARVIDMFEIVDVLNGWTKDEAGEHHTDTVGGVVLFHVLPDSQFPKFLSRAVTDVGIIYFTRVFECDLKIGD